MQKAILAVAMFAAGSIIGSYAQSDTELAVRNVERAKAIVDVTWQKTIKGSTSNMYMADTYNTQTGSASSSSDVWPYTAAIEAHCSLLEALEAIKEINPDLYNNNYETYRTHLNQLLDNLDYYRGTYRLSSYATSNKEWSPFAVPRANTRGGADVSGILNVYDDQMWLAREIIRAYRITGENDYLELAAYLTDYVLDGWDCWRDDNGNEYGGITWGPGYNSKHACSNAPIIQPLVWLYEIYKDSDAEVEYYYRDESNSAKHEPRNRAEHYLEFAKKVYTWQRDNLYSSAGVYYDMKGGVDGNVQVKRGYRQHVDCGNAGGNYYSYNTGTMIAGGAELYKITGDETYQKQLSTSINSSRTQFTTYNRSLKSYVLKTDDVATSGFNTWFNDVLVRGIIDAEAYCTNSSAKTVLNSMQTALDYAFENNNRNNMLPIKLVDGWGDEVVTKGFHQFAFASEYAMLAVRLLNNLATEGVTTVNADAAVDDANAMVYTLGGIALGPRSKVEANLPRGLYIVGKTKRYLGR
jgi:predicted alpha-1,6-mannanase (GH76 family)